MDKSATSAALHDEAVKRYQPYQPVDLPDRTWPTKTIAQAPVWCSVDLRDGNQALINPMDAERKLRMFNLLVRLGFKEIEIGFPAASQTEYDFARHIIEQGLVPDDVTIQVLTQSRPELIERTFESVRGARRAIIHLYNSTSTLQRRVVFRTGRAGVKSIAVGGAKLVRELAEQDSAGTEFVFEYSPESFTGTELDFAAEVCDSVCEIWQPGAGREVILNLPATVEMSTPNVYADQIEWMGRNLSCREQIVLSLHPHNDRGCAVAATELGLLAGADRVEGTLFGNGERTGNVDVVTLALNLMSQGIPSGLDFSDIAKVVSEATECNQLPVHPRHPYAGELVFTAFSGSHQDAIKKGFEALEHSNSPYWEVPYLPIDPADLGLSYEPLIRINSQSGKGGIAWQMERFHDRPLPRGLQIEFSKVVQKITDDSGREISGAELGDAFDREYLQANSPWTIQCYSSIKEGDEDILTAIVEKDGQAMKIAGQGNGPLDAFVNALEDVGLSLRILDYQQQAIIDAGSASKAVSFLQVAQGSKKCWGVAEDPSVVSASLEAILRAANRMEPKAKTPKAKAPKAKAKAPKGRTEPDYASLTQNS